MTQFEYAPPFELDQSLTKYPNYVALN